jgi:uncharacterized protein YecT (DUF1311 family)
MLLPARLTIAALLGLAAATASASDDQAAWQAEQQADARVSVAQQRLSDTYTAVWASLDASQKARFSAQERAWLNDGRQQEVRACVARNGNRSGLVVKTCEADVIERHLGGLNAPHRVASSS